MKFPFSFEIGNKATYLYEKDVEYRVRSATIKSRALSTLKLASKTPDEN